MPSICCNPRCCSRKGVKTASTVCPLNIEHRGSGIDLESNAVRSAETSCAAALRQEHAVAPRGHIKPKLNRKVCGQRRVAGKRQIIPTPIKVAAATDRASAVRRKWVEGRERLDRWGAVYRNSKCVATIVNKAVALTSQQRGVRDSS